MGTDQTYNLDGSVRGGGGGGKPVIELWGGFRSESEASGKCRRREAPQLKLIGSDDGKETRAATSGRPKQIGMIPFVGHDDIAIGRDHFDGADVCAGWSPFPRIPAEAARENITAQCHVRTVANRESIASLRQALDKLATGHPCADPGGARIVVYRDVAEPGEIEQQAPITKCGRFIVMAAATRRDLQLVPGSITDGIYHIGSRDWECDQIGRTRAIQALVPNQLLACIAEVGGFTPEGKR